MKPIIIYAGIGAGKTTHAKALTDLFGAKGCVDDWSRGDPIPNDFIALTSQATAGAIDATDLLYQIRAIKNRQHFDFMSYGSRQLFNVSDSPLDANQHIKSANIAELLAQAQADLDMSSALEAGSDKQRDYIARIHANLALAQLMAKELMA